MSGSETAERVLEKAFGAGADLMVIERATLHAMVEELAASGGLARLKAAGVSAVVVPIKLGSF